MYVFYIHRNGLDTCMYFKQSLPSAFSKSFAVKLLEQRTIETRLKVLIKSADTYQ